MRSLLIVMAMVDVAPAAPTPTASGNAADRAMVERHIKSADAKVQQCYDKELPAKPQLAGTVNVSLAIDAAGKVTKSEGNGVDPVVASCIADVMKSIVFDKPSKAPLAVTYPFVFDNPPQVSGTPADAAMVRRVLQANRAAFTACYDKARAANPSLEAATAKVTFTVDTSGKVSKAGGLGGALVGCVVGVVRGLSFDKPSKATDVTYPIAFTPDPAPVIPRIGGTTSDKAMVRKHLKKHITKIQLCYDKELATKPGIEGTVTVQFTVSANGLVSRISASGIDPAVAKCVVEVVRNVVFDPPESSPLEIKYPFTFRLAEP